MLVMTAVALLAIVFIPFDIVTNSPSRLSEPAEESRIRQESETSPASSQTEAPSEPETESGTESQAESAAPAEQESSSSSMQTQSGAVQSSRPQQQKPAGSSSSSPASSSRPSTSSPSSSSSSRPAQSQPSSSAPSSSRPNISIKPEWSWPQSSKPSSGASSEKTESGTTNPSYVQQVVTLVNEERAKEGLQPLRINQSAAAAAQVRAKEIVSSFSHTRPNGSSFSTALDEQGTSYRRSGENIAWGQKSPQQVVQGWMNSPGHRANIMNASFTEIGVGFYRSAAGTNYWTQLFIG